MLHLFLFRFPFARISFGFLLPFPFLVDRYEDDDTRRDDSEYHHEIHASASYQHDAKKQPQQSEARKSENFISVHIFFKPCRHDARSLYAKVIKILHPDNYPIFCTFYSDKPLHYFGCVNFKLLYINDILPDFRCRWYIFTAWEYFF